jgi:hypothetical protein
MLTKYGGGTTMRAKAAVLFLLCTAASGLAGGQPSAAGPRGAPTPPEIGQTAVAYANALAVGDLATAWNLLSTESRTQVPLPAWENAFRQAPASRKAAPNAILRALATAPTAPVISGVLPRAEETLIQIGGSVQITQQVALVREAPGWRVDLASSDLPNSRQAARTFLDAVRADAAVSRATTSSEDSLALLRTLFAAEAKDYRVLEARLEGEERAQVTVAAEVPVNVVLRACRVGPGWAVDIARAVVPVDATSPDPLKEAAALEDQGACEEQLRQLARAIQMYAAASDDMFPDPGRWLDQIRDYLPGPAQGEARPPVHCPADAREGISYAMNLNLAGKRRREIGSPAATPVLFESTLHSDNPADAGQSWADPPRHPGGNAVLFADGTVRTVGRKPSFYVTVARPGVGPESAGGRRLPFRIPAPVPER